MTVVEALRNRVFLQLAFVEMMRVMVSMAVLTHVMPYLAQSGMSRPTAGFIAAGIPLVSIIGRFALGGWRMSSVRNICTPSPSLARAWGCLHSLSSI